MKKESIKSLYIQPNNQNNTNRTFTEKEYIKARFCNYLYYIFKIFCKIIAISVVFVYNDDVLLSPMTMHIIKTLIFS